MTADGGTRAGARRQRSRRGAIVAGVMGELLITVGAIALLFVAWQLWIGDLIIGAQHSTAASTLSKEWAQERTATPSPDATTPPPSPDATPTPVTAGAEPVILPEPADTAVFGVMRVPRFGADYAVQIAGGVTRSGTLDSIGIGHYPGTPMPGSVGNVALAAHRTTFGAPFNRIAELRLGDAVVIETPEGWYTYRFRTLEYVTPDAVDVLLPVPQEAGAAADGRYLTLTSCAPMYSRAERIIAYTVFESYTPRAAGEPTSLAAAAA